MLVITIGAATHHHLQHWAAVSQGFVGGPWAPKASRRVAAAGRVGSRTMAASRRLAQHCGGGRAEPVLAAHASNESSGGASSAAPSLP